MTDIHMHPPTKPYQRKSTASTSDDEVELPIAPRPSFLSSDDYTVSPMSDIYDLTSLSGVQHPEKLSLQRTSTSSYKPEVLKSTSNRKYDPTTLNIAVTLGVPLTMMVMGIILEILAAISRHDGGFHNFKSTKVLGLISPQFFLSFFPTLIILPIIILWRSLDRYLRLYQPPMILWRGNVPAKESVMLNYIAQQVFATLIQARAFGHNLIFWSAFTVLVTYAFQPLASSVFQFRMVPRNISRSLEISESIGSSANANDMFAFIAAAGYTEASVEHNLSDPPLVFKGSAIAAFNPLTTSYLNGTMTFPTIGINTEVNCANSASLTFLSAVNNAGALIVDTTSVDGCKYSGPLPVTGTPQSAVMQVQCPGDSANASVSLMSVAFLFLQNRPDAGDVEAVSIFCSPKAVPRKYSATINLNNNFITSITDEGVYVSDSDITIGGPTGEVFNGMVFDPQDDPLINLRASTLPILLPSAIFRAAELSAHGTQGIFDQEDGFLNLTNKLYSRYLSVAARSTYFVSSPFTTTPSEINSLVERIMINQLPAHILAVLLILVGSLGLYLQMIFRRERNELNIISEPGSIASTVALTSHSSFGKLLDPGDDQLAIASKLKNIRFSMDRQTGAIFGVDIGAALPSSNPDPQTSQHRIFSAVSSATLLS